ncbi:MAG: hypothetical protein JNL13_07825 [Chitinophagaceae bacterium]|nr:hypothetical protein [Chitinophagaceae bacterium]
MSTDKKAKPAKPRGKYEKPIAVNASFMDVIGAAIKQADKKMGKKKESHPSR